MNGYLYFLLSITWHVEQEDSEYRDSQLRTSDDSGKRLLNEHCKNFGHRFLFAAESVNK